MTDSLTPIQQAMQQEFAALQPEFGRSLADQTYMKIGGPAEVFIVAPSARDAIAIAAFCHEHSFPLTILGGASNVLIPDEGVPGVVLSLANHTFAQAKNHLTFGAGTKMALVVRESVDAGYTGLEPFLGVPGTLGGAVFNNAHYLQHLIGEFVSRVRVWSPAKQDHWLTAAECKFGYDDSIFQHEWALILEVEFELTKGKREASLALIRQATEYRASTQPVGQPSSGCYFRNVPNTPKLQELFPQFAARREVPAGFLIDQAGLKGKRVGDVVMSEKHAAFLVNLGHGTSKEVLELADEVRATVKEKFDVELEPEVFFMRHELGGVLASEHRSADAAERRERAS